MLKPPYLTLLFTTLSVMHTQAHALETNFIVYDGHQSYATGFTEGWSQDLMDQYMVLYSDNMERFIGLWPNSFTVSSVSIPIYSKPGDGMVVGTSACYADPDDAAKAGTGMRTLDSSPGNWVNTMLSTSLPVGQISHRYREGAFENTDATAKLSILSFAILDNIRINTLTLGVGLRKQVWGTPLTEKRWLRYGAAVSGGLQYSRFLARERDIYVGTSGEVPDEPGRLESVTVPGGEVLVSRATSDAVTADYERDDSALAHYRYIEAHALALEAGVSAYATLLNRLDLFMGLGGVLLPVNMVYLDLATEVNVKVTNGSDEESHDGELTLDGTVHGSRLLPKLVVGAQLSVWKMRLPIQYSQTLQGERERIKALSAGLTVAIR